DGSRPVWPGSEPAGGGPRPLRGDAGCDPQTLGLRRAVSLPREIFSGGRAGYGPGERTRFLHEAVSKTPSAHRCGSHINGLHVDSTGWGEGVDPMSSSLLAPLHLKDHWRMVEAGAASAGRAADRQQWRIGRDIFVAETSALAREHARQVLGRNYLRHQLPN